MHNKSQPASLYETDFFRWTQEQTRALREERVSDIDWDNIAEEIETLGRSEKQAIGNRFGILLLHLLRWQFQPELRSPTWRGKIAEQRVRILRLLEENPSLRTHPEQIAEEEYAIARLKAASETGLALAAFPVQSPYTVAQALDEDFYPSEQS